MGHASHRTPFRCISGRTCAVSPVAESADRVASRILTHWRLAQRRLASHEGIARSSRWRALAHETGTEAAQCSYRIDSRLGVKVTVVQAYKVFVFPPHRADKTRVLYAVQAPFNRTLLAGKTTHAAWRSKPSWYAVSTEDRTINPDLERFMAKRMGANTIKVKASHLSLISQPDTIADLILHAAQGT